MLTTLEDVKEAMEVVKEARHHLMCAEIHHRRLAQDFLSRNGWSTSSLDGARLMTKVFEGSVELTLPWDEAITYEQSQTEAEQYGEPLPS
jgi:hypothetical protein